MADYDVVTLGETMLRLSPPGSQRLEQALRFEVGIGGAESNVAVGLARLGLRVAWISKLVRNPLGRRIVADIRAGGVDLSGVVWTDEGRVGTYYIEPGTGVRPTTVIYDRAGAVITTLTPDEIPWSMVENARLAYTTGITPALSEDCWRVVQAWFDHAQAAGIRTGFDINYRSKLWPPQVAAKVLAPLCARTDLLIAPLKDVYQVFGLVGSPETVLDELRRRFDPPTVVLTMGDEGVLCAHKGEVYVGEVYQVTGVGRIGVGDAFAAGFIYGYLAGDVEMGLRYGVAMAALKFSIPGDLPWVTLEEVEAVARRSGVEVER